MKKKKIKRILQVTVVSLACLFCYLLCGVVLLNGATEREVKTKVESVPYTVPTDSVAVLAECEELSHYAAVFADFENKSISVVLFSDRSHALEYGFSYRRTVKYSAEDEVDIIGHIGGIVIGGENGYNGSGFSEPERIFGSRVIELADSAPEKRALLAYEFLHSLLAYDMRKTDFMYLVGICDTDISYADFCRYREAVASCIDSISVIAG